MADIFQTLTKEQRRVMYNALSDRMNLAHKRCNEVAQGSPQWRAWQDEYKIAKDLRDEMHNFGTVIKGIAITVRRINPIDIPIDRGMKH